MKTAAQKTEIVAKELSHIQAGCDASSLLRTLASQFSQLEYAQKQLKAAERKIEIYSQEEKPCVMCAEEIATETRLCEGCEVAQQEYESCAGEYLQELSQG